MSRPVPEAVTALALAALLVLLPAASAQNVTDVTGRLHGAPPVPVANATVPRVPAKVPALAKPDLEKPLFERARDAVGGALDAVAGAFSSAFQAVGDLGHRLHEAIPTEARPYVYASWGGFGALSAALCDDNPECAQDA